MRQKLTPARIVAAVFPLLTLLAVPGESQTACADLAKFHAANLTVTTAEPESAPYKLAGGGGGTTVNKPFCRVAGYLTPTSDSHIGFELWLPPADAWNHKLEAVGNGGFSGSLNYRAMLPGLTRGYATMTTDLGHLSDQVENLSWALGHPEKFIDYSYRAEHLSTEASKQLIGAFYGSAPTHAYYTGCSAGGIQGLVELLRYPKDYDGYVIGDATPDHLGQEIAAFWNTMQASLADPANALTPEQISMVHEKVLQQCTGKDGGSSTDKFLSNPLVCKFDPSMLACSAGKDAGSCLSPKQIAELNAVLKGPTDTRTHQAVFSGLTPGTETTWDRYFSGKKNPVGTERPWAGFLTDVAFSDPAYLTEQKYLHFDFGKDLDKVRLQKLGGETLEAVFNTKSRNLDPVKLEGGKVIQYHGWEDSNIPALEAVGFYQSVVADQAKRHSLSPLNAQAETQDFYRLFMVPGMGHCSGGAGASNFGQGGGRPVKLEAETDPLTALETWVEKGSAPEKFIGSRVDNKTGTVDMTRPICAYPKTPVWNGVGKVDEASSFTCSDPKK